MSTSSVTPPGSGVSTGGIIHGSMNWEPVRKRLLGPDLGDALKAATELREGIEIVHTTEFPLMLSALLPAFSSILAHRTRPSADTTSLEHKLRNTVLEIISRMPSNEVLRPHAPHLVALSIDILNRDYEDNALLASRVIFDLYKVYRSLPQDYVQPYLDFVVASYRALPVAIQRNFAPMPPQAVATSPIPPSDGTAKTQFGKPSTGSPASAPAPAPAPATPTSKSTPAVHTPESTTSPMSGLGTVSPRPTLALRANLSFRCLCENPLLVMLKFQLYPGTLPRNIPVLINVMMEALSMRAPAIQSLVPPGTTMDPNNKRHYFSKARELVAAQAKTLSFLTYLLRGFSKELKPYEDRLASNVVALMSTCPRESISTRKELLVATRHLLNSDFRTGFFSHVDALLDERVLMGCNHRYSEQTVLRPLAYTALSDLIHHVKTRLNMKQMSKVVCMFSRILHDSSSTLPLSTQYTAVRTLLSVVEIIFQNKDPNPQIGRDMLVRILSTLVHKLSTLKEYFAAVKKSEGSHSSDGSQIASDLAAMTFGAAPHAPFSDDAHQHHTFLPEKGGGDSRERNFDGNIDVSDSWRDLRSMIRAIVVGHKTVIWYINNYRSQREKDRGREKSAPVAGSNEEVASAMLKMTNSERALVDTYIMLAIPCMKFLKEEPPSSGGGEQGAQSSPAGGRKPVPSDQYRDVLSYFAAAFTTLDGYDLKRTLGKRLDILVDAIVEDSAIMVVPRHLLGSNSTTSYEFCAILLKFLVEQMDALSISKSTEIRFLGPSLGRDLREVETLNPLVDQALQPPTDNAETIENRATTYLQLFERVLKSLTVYPDNEAALRPYLRRIVSTCLRSSLEEADRWPDNYCMLLRYVFRSVSAGKFEESYKELLPLIPAALNGLYRVIIATNCCLIRNTIIELCLTIPARLSSLLPHMNLLLRIIVKALSSNSGDLVNLGLRTLEFWVDNLNPDFLYPELSKQTTLFTELMQGLSQHLKPAPYPYGLLTLRLLGKLGGKNRRFLRDPIDVRTEDLINSVPHLPVATDCIWLGESAATTGSHTKVVAKSFAVPLPLEKCVERLKVFAATDRSKKRDHDKSSTETLPEMQPSWAESANLWKFSVEEVDFGSYCSDVMEKTKRQQASSAFRVIRAALAAVLEIDDVKKCTWEVAGCGCAENEAKEAEEGEKEGSEAYCGGLGFDSQVSQSHSNAFLCMSVGIMYGCVINETREEAELMLKGLASHIYYVVLSYHQCFKRIDANGSPIRDDLCAKDTAPLASEEGNDQKMDGGESGADGSRLELERLGSLKPFGYFHRVGILRERIDPLLFNQAVADFLAGAPQHALHVGVRAVKQLLSLATDSGTGEASTTSSKDASPGPGQLCRATLVFFENLISHLCKSCFSNEWNQRDGPQEAICVIVEELGSEWGLRYEEELMNVAFFVVSSVPRELSTAVVKSYQFFVRLCIGLYGRPRTMDTDSGLIWDALAVVDETKPEQPAKEQDGKVATRLPCTGVLQVVLTELASCKQIVRIAARFILKHFITTHPKDVWSKLFTSQMSLMRRVIFSRSLRLLPLAEQVGAVEALSFMMKEAISIFPLSDQHLLAFLSELLKMSSVADGEMSDAALAGFVVDKNGNALTAKKTSSQSVQKPEKHPSHASTIFFRRECILEMGGLKFVVPEELPHGVQIRVSSITLLRSVITGNPDAFFDAAVSTPIGNIRPHVVSLLFRSLVSNPLRAVLAAHEALREVLTLSVVAKENPEKSRSQSRLKSDLIQTCIRPVLLNLREHTRLSVPLLRGLSRLLSLLSSWFNKTLGEKLLDHLQKWTDPSLIKSHKIWTPGEEPFVAAAIIDLFSLLPHASHFVEPLVKTTIKLEAYLPGFNAHCVGSPYRKPLARYLNKHCQYTVGFFFQRLKAPIYSELFQHIVRLEECSALRTYLSGRQCSVMMLNVCFERPLAIIRSEKSTGTSPQPKPSSSTDAVDLFHLHGIQTDSKPIAQGGTIIKQDLEVKKKNLVTLQQEFTKAKDAMQAAVGPAGEEAKKQHKLAKAALENGTKELNEAKQRYAAEFARGGSTKQDSAASTSASGPRPMNTESLELQHQGFLLVEALIAKNDSYLKEHNDAVRACRWLWRSKGRYLRLQHEDSVSPRYHEESKILSKFLMRYSKSFPSDVDVLFELIRIFLQPATTDFSFVRVFLAETVGGLDVVHQKQVIQRFFALLAGESTEETKALSIQLLLFPLLCSSLKRSTAATPETGKTQGKKTPDKAPMKNDKPGAAASGVATVLVDAAMVQRFVKEVLYDKGGHPINCGDKLKVELLRVTNAILEHAPERMDKFQKEIIRFCWSLIKSEDALCKAWAYVVVCRLISLFETQAKYVLQVYAALLRSHQQEGKNLVRMALALLVPALKERLSADDFKKSIETTSRIMFEDGSVPQLAHIWHTIVTNPEVYYDDCLNFVRYMVNSLNRLGLPPNSPPENRILAVSIIGLLIEWDSRRKNAPNDQTATENSLTLKRKSTSKDGSPAKKQKGTTGASVQLIDDSVLLDKSMVETISNFLVRLKVLLADPKVEAGASNLDSRIMKVFRSVLNTWPSCLIRPVYFEKVVMHCKEEASLERSNKALPESNRAPSKSDKQPTRTSASKGAASQDTKKDEKLVTSDMLSACLDIFSALIDVAPMNAFTGENADQMKAILASCFRHVSQGEGSSIRPKLHSFIIGLHKASSKCMELLLFINALLEGLICSNNVDKSSTSAPSGEQSRPTVSSRGREKHEANDDKDSYSQIIEFTLEIIQDVCKLKQDYFMVFSSSLLALGSRLVKKHLSETAAKQRQGMSHSQQSGNAATPQLHATPTLGIIEQVCSEDPSFGIASVMSKPTLLKQTPTFKNSVAQGMPLRSLVIIVRMLGLSDIPFEFSEDRKVLFHIISTILDSSDDVQLLMAAVKVVGGWLLGDARGGGLTTKERNSFLWKIASFDSIRLPDVESQPLADLVAHFVIKFLEERGIATEATADKATKGSQNVSENDDLIIGRSLMACLLNANTTVRDKLLSLYAVQGLEPSNKTEASSGGASATVEPRTGFETFWQLLHSDYEGLGGRCWNVVFVEVLLRSCVWKGGLHEKTHKKEGMASKSSNQSWLPPPKWKSPSGKSKKREVYTKFCEKVNELNVPENMRHSECLQALQVLAHGDIGIAKDLFDALLPSAWDGVPNDDTRLRLAPAIESLLSRPFHSQIFRQSKTCRSEKVAVNAVRFFLNALMSFHPKPLLDTILLVTLAENYNCWFEVLTLLQQQYTIMKAHKEKADLADKALSAMRHCHRHIGDFDLWRSLAFESCVLPESKEALAMDLYGLVSDASEAYSHLVERYQADDPLVQKASDFELNMWEERWIELQRELCQQEVVNEFANLSENPRILLETAWKSRDWDKVQQLVASPPLVAAVEAGDPEIKMCETLLAVANGKLSDVENSHAQAAQLCLYKWQQLPMVSRGSSSHASLLHLFHRLVEVRESGQIMVETSNHSAGRTLPDLKNLLNAWRHRLPNDYDRLTTWDDVVTWRTHMFSAIAEKFRWSEPNTLATLHDRPWTAIRIAKTARKQGTRDVALLLLNREAQANRSMDVTDAFLKLREQILAYDNPDSDIERTGGLNLINTTNLSFFDAPQKSELFRLKALFLASLGLRSKSNQAFCHSVQICPSHARAWVSWGGLCSNLGALTEKQMEQAAAKSGTEPSKETRANTAKKVAQYLAQSMGCYFEAIQLNTHEWSRIHLPKCLLMLVKDGSSPGVLCQTLENRGAALPPWVWLPWIPHLLSCLCRNEGKAVKAILARLVKSYPQAVYYALRAFYLERRDVERAKGPSTVPGVAHMGSVSYAEEMMSTLRRSHASLWSSLESILEELIVKFRPSYSEELLATITALIERADSQPGSSGSEKGKDDPDAMVTSVSKTLGRIAVKFFRSSNTDSSSGRNDERARKTAEFKTRYKAQFETEFKVSSSEKEQAEKGPQFTLNEYLVLLKRWRRRLETQVAATPLALPLMESSHALSLFASDAPDLWPGACDPRKSSSSQPDRTQSNFETDSRTSQSSTSSSAAAARKAASSAALAVATAAAKEGVGGDYGGGSACIEIPGQYPPNAASSADLKPNPELHAKLLYFEPTVEVLRREQLVRRISMVGSDGRTYRFLLQFAIPYWTRTDERVAQTQYVLDKILRKEFLSSRQQLSVQPNSVIPVAQRLRMTADATSRMSLDEIYKRKCHAKGEDATSIMDYYNQELAKVHKGDSKKTAEDADSLRCQVFRKVCSKTDDTLLLRHMTEVLRDPEALFQFRRSFSDQLAVNSLLQYAFSVAERTPPRVVFTQSNGRVQCPDFRVTYSSQGFIESRTIPFRMTPNLSTMVGLPFMNGRFVTSISTVAEAIRNCKEEMDPVLRLLMRDDIVSWYCKSMAKSDSKLQELERQLADRVSKNVSYLTQRFSECAPRKIKDKSDSETGPIDKKVRDLISVASSPDQLCMMPTSYQAWL